jgi:hypothetical protein
VAPHVHTPAAQVPAPPPLQLASPLQPQTPPVHTKFAAQAWPQAPQLVALVSRAMQPPLLQHVRPELQAAAPLQLHPFGRHVSPCLHVLELHWQTPATVSQVPLLPHWEFSVHAQSEL